MHRSPGHRATPPVRCTGLTPTPTAATIVAVTESGVAEKAGEWFFGPMDEAGARAITLWHYPPPYSFYDCPAGAIEQEVRCLLNPEHRYWAVREEGGELVGFVGVGEDCRVPGGDYSAEALDVGGGLRPDRTGRGLGAGFWNAALEVTARHCAPATFRVTVAAFNGRALRVWERLGFRRVETLKARDTNVLFVILVREAAAPAE